MPPPGSQWKELQNYEEREFVSVGVYRGQIIHPKGLHGRGTFVYQNGDVYEGDVRTRLIDCVPFFTSCGVVSLMTLFRRSCSSISPPSPIR